MFDKNEVNANSKALMILFVPQNCSGKQKRVQWSRSCMNNREPRIESLSSSPNWFCLSMSLLFRKLLLGGSKYLGHLLHSTPFPLLSPKLRLDLDGGSIPKSNIRVLWVQFCIINNFKGEGRTDEIDAQNLMVGEGGLFPCRDVEQQYLTYLLLD